MAPGWNLVQVGYRGRGVRYLYTNHLYGQSRNRTDVRLPRPLTFSITYPSSPCQLIPTPEKLSRCKLLGAIPSVLDQVTSAMTDHYVVPDMPKKRWRRHGH